MITPSAIPPDECLHLMMEVKGFNALGIELECAACDSTLVMDPEQLEKSYFLFTHTSPQGEQNDIHLYIHENVVEGES